jgi:hypothetical protein
MDNLFKWFDELTKKSKEFYELNQTIKKFNIEIIGTTHSDPTHFVPELLQNADDQKADEIYFNFNSLKNEIRFSHNGNNFTKQDIQDICSIGHSQKNETINKIGKFGTGFKSIYKVTDKPIISCFLESQKTQIIFSIENKIIPIREKNNYQGLEISEKKFDTNFFFRLISNDVLNEKILIEFIKDNATSMLLFLPNIRKLFFEVDNEKYIFRREDKKISENFLISNIYTDIGTKEEICSFYRFSKKIKLQNYQGETDIVVAYQFNKSNFISDDKKLLNVFFKTKEYTGYSFLIHGPFFLDESRKHIDQSDPNNEVIAKEFDELIIESVNELKEKKFLNISFFNLLPNSEDNITYLPNIQEKIYEVIDNEAVWPTEEGTFEKKENVFYGKDEFRKCFSFDDIKKLRTNQKWIQKSVESNNKLFEDFNIKEFNGGLVEELLEDDLLNEFLKNKTDSQLVDLYLLFLNEKNLYDRTTCNNKKIIKAKDGQFFSGDDIKFPIKKNDYQDGISYINPNFLENKKYEDKYEKLELFFKSCGVKKVNQIDLLNNELKKLNLIENKKIEVNLRSYISFLKKCVEFYTSYSNSKTNEIDKSKIEDDESKITKHDYIKNLSDQIFLIDEDKIARTNDELYIDDKKNHETGLSTISNILKKHKIYIPKEAEIKTSPLIKFLREFYIKEKLDIEENYFSESHDERFDAFDQRSRNQTRENAIDDDYDLELIDEIVNKIDKKKSLLILKTINNLDQLKYCNAQYKPRKSDPKTSIFESTFLKKIKKHKWIPSKKGKFENVFYFTKKPKELDNKFYKELKEFWRDKLFIKTRIKNNKVINKFLDNLNLTDDQKNSIRNELEKNPNLIKKLLLDKIESIKKTGSAKATVGRKHAGPLNNSDKKPNWNKIDIKKINKKYNKPKEKSKGRDPNISRQIKINYNYQCQICIVKKDFIIGTYGEEEKNRRKLTEAAHIKDASDSGLATFVNLLCLCKNCHDKYSEEPNYIMPKIKNTIKENSNPIKCRIFGLKGFKYKINNNNENVFIFFQDEHVKIIKKYKKL